MALSTLVFAVLHLYLLMNLLHCICCMSLCFSLVGRLRLERLLAAKAAGSQSLGALADGTLLDAPSMTSSQSSLQTLLNATNKATIDTLTQTTYYYNGRSGAPADKAASCQCEAIQKNKDCSLQCVC